MILGAPPTWEAYGDVATPPRVSDVMLSTRHLAFHDTTVRVWDGSLLPWWEGSLTQFEGCVMDDEPFRARFLRRAREWHVLAEAKEPAQRVLMLAGRFVDRHPAVNFQSGDGLVGGAVANLPEVDGLLGRRVMVAVGGEAFTAPKTLQLVEDGFGPHLRLGATSLAAVLRQRNAFALPRSYVCLIAEPEP